MLESGRWINSSVMCVMSKDSDGDIVLPEERSRNMVTITSRDIKPEVYLRKLLFVNGYRYWIVDKIIPGQPDIFLRSNDNVRRDAVVTEELQKQGVK